MKLCVELEKCSHTRLCCVAVFESKDTETHLDDKVDKLVLVHLLSVKVGDKKANVIALHQHSQKLVQAAYLSGCQSTQHIPSHPLPSLCHHAILTSMGLRRNTKKFSARIIMKRINFLQRIFSISSAYGRVVSVRGYVMLFSASCCNRFSVAIVTNLFDCNANAHRVD